MNTLFDSVPFADRLRAQIQKAIDAVPNLGEGEIQEGSTSEVSESLFGRHLADLPVLDIQGITKAISLVRLDDRQVGGFDPALSAANPPKTKVVVFSVPYLGDSTWFEARPSDHAHSKPSGFVKSRNVEFYVVRGEKTAKQAHEEFLSALEQTVHCLKLLEAEREAAKAGAMDALCLAIDAEKAKRAEDQKFMEELPYPYR